MSRHSVALLIETSNGYCRGLLEGISAFARQKGDWSLHLNEQERGAAPPDWLKDWDGDGIIARIETDQIGDRLKELKVPIVDLSAARFLPGIPWADTQDRAISQLAVEHFLERGFSNLAYCGDPGFAWSNSRRDHYQSFVKEANGNYFEYQSIHRYEPNYRWDTVRASISKWLKSLPRPLAIMACNDYQGQLILDVCRSESISVPEEIAVLGVDDDRLICELCEPNLSSVIPDTFGTGFEAAELLQRMMNREHIGESVRLMTQPLGVRVRQSTDTIAIQDQEVAKALSYIRRNALSNIRVGDVLKQGGISRRALEHRFLKHVGHTPHDEIHRVRVLRIKQLLEESDESIVDIARRTGYEYPEYMAAAFKRTIGMSPTQYRAAHRKPRHAANTLQPPSLSISNRL